MINNLISANELFMLLFTEQQCSIGGAANVNDTQFKVELYPYKEKIRREAIRVTVIIKSGKKKMAKRNFTVSRVIENTPCCQLSDKSNKVYNIPLILIKEIYSYIQQVEIKWKNGESIETISKPNPTIKEFGDKYFYPNLKEQDPDEVSRYSMVMEYWKDYKVKDVSSIDIERYKIEKLKERASGTVRKYCLILRTIFELTVELGYRTKNPFSNVKLPSNKAESEGKPFEITMLPHVFKTLKASDELLFKYCVMLYLTGLRCGDIINLKYEHIKMDKGIKVIEIQERKNKKRNRGKTTIPIHPDLEKLTFKENGIGYILKSDFSRKSLHELLARRFRKFFPDIEQTPYNFRHTFATLLNAFGIDRTHVEFLLGKLPEGGTTKNYLKSIIDVLSNDIRVLPSVSDYLEDTRDFSRIFHAREKCVFEVDNTALKNETNSEDKKITQTA